MVLPERPVTALVNAVTPTCAPSVVVAMTVESVESVPYAKPDCVAFAPPVTVMSPFSVAVVAVTEEAAEVVTVGAHAEVVNDDDIAPYEVPEELVAYALE